MPDVIEKLNHSIVQHNPMKRCIYLIESMNRQEILADGMRLTINSAMLYWPPHVKVDTDGKPIITA